MRTNFLMGLAFGIGATLAGPGAWRAGRPAAKKALRAGVEGYLVARKLAARMGEEIEDLVAEVAHEIKEAAAEGDAIRQETFSVVGGTKAPANE